MNEEQKKAWEFLKSMDIFFDEDGADRIKMGPPEIEKDESGKEWTVRKPIRDEKGEIVMVKASEEERRKEAQTINQNDTWAWALSFRQEVPDEDLPGLARLARTYGYCGVLYYVSEKNEQMRSEFEDNQRHVDFVRREEQIRNEEPDYNERAYKQVQYTLGMPRCQRCWNPFADGDRYEFRPFEKSPDIVWKICTECHLEVEA
jgi:hypothetical protein